MADNLFEYYKLYAEMADKISERRMRTNSFYMVIMTSLITFYSTELIIIKKLVATLGVLLALIWIININIYKNINSKKYKVICELEETLLFNGYTREWGLIKNDEKCNHLDLTNIERFIPGVFIILWVIIYFFQ